MTYEESIGEENRNDRCSQNGEIDRSVLLGYKEGQRASRKSSLINPSQLVEIDAGTNVDRRHEEDKSDEGEPNLAGLIFVVNDRTNCVVAYCYMDT